MKSSFPEILRSTKSSYFKPTKQGNLYSIKLKSINYQTVPTQLQQFVSIPIDSIVNPQKSQKLTTRTATAQTNKQHRNLSLANFTRNTVSHQTQRKPVPTTRLSSSRQSTRQIKKDLLKNYQNTQSAFQTQTQTLAIRQKNQNQQSLKNILNENIKLTNKMQQQFFEVIKQNYQLRTYVSRFYDRIDEQCNKIKKETHIQIDRLKNILSVLRRQTGPQIKKNKKDFQQISEMYKNMSIVFNSIDQRYFQVAKLCN